MKKLIALFLAATLSIGCLTACGNKTKEEKPAEVTTEAAQEASTEAAAEEELSPEFAAFLDGIYAAQPGTAGGSEKTAAAAEAFTEYALANGEDTTPDAITYATTLYLNKKMAEDENFLANFEEAFAAVCDTCVDVDETLEDDANFLKFVNGIDAAVDALVGPAPEENGDLNPEFAAFLDSIYAAQPGTAGGSEKTAAAAEAFKEYVFANGEGTTPEAITYATSLYFNEKMAEDENFLANFEESFAAVCDACLEADESLEGDTSFLKFADGIDAAIEEMFEE